ncbi:ATP-binding cassette domain-containing protein [Paenibacillus sp. SYP-B3998]|uniref:ATP-binding cassette domain-containing protein n=1 Tax=Paenibacillus sp. SYP-B3998 TaxID=2678564 RepID=A0A6G3ZVR3_9BACL|nr:ATP-binding cassette domain-containing protein [Paenibacillus sp. SYP-B3998]NEW06303.1 ATP-binding cassette domain-containing protein [Paenibacillus sp. SYP-B3998]
MFDRINATILMGDRIAMLGPSGQGKSTLLRLLARLDLIDSGRLTLHGKESAGWHPSDWRKKVCYVPQLPVMLPTTVADNLAVASKLHQRKFDKPLALELMEQVGLGELDWNQKAADLSGGQKQRLQLVRSLLLRPDLLLLDEVTSALDGQSKQAVERLLMRWCEQERLSLVWVTHEEQQARRVSNRLWILEGGTLVEGSTAVVIERSGLSGASEGGQE